MNLLTYTSALIIDLRQNHGGYASMVALLASYLFEEQVELSGIYWRAQDRINQSRTLPYVPGRRYADKPVYVLTSNITFSAAEAFAYDLKHLKRAVLVGEITGGGAHPGGGYSLDEHVGIAMPTGRAVNPITGTNWEGTGVTPDIIVPQDEALKIAHREALKKILESVGMNPSGVLKTLVGEAHTALEELDNEK